MMGSIAAFIASVAIMEVAVDFATDHASNGVSDIILSNTPIFDVGYIYVYGFCFFLACIAFICLTNPKRLPFLLYSSALFMAVRGVFVMMTHLGPFTPYLPIDFGTTITSIFYGNDYFFSGHTGAPFLIALIYWKEKAARWIFLAWSVFFGVVVLLGHLHYTIDVASAYFIAYGVYHIALHWFPREKAFFDMSHADVL
ncbi:hypothetical protein HZC00_02090 [Candidatus Kaiserbacteria bacterium]|nr:hypothetical protein [Candidatus Kaiserbacteria bacterium]